MEATMAREHSLDKSKVHHKWDKRTPPAIETESGDTVHCETVERGVRLKGWKVGRLEFSRLGGVKAERP